MGIHEHDYYVFLDCCYAGQSVLDVMAPVADATPQPPAHRPVSCIFHCSERTVVPSPSPSTHNRFFCATYTTSTRRCPPSSLLCYRPLFTWPILLLNGNLLFLAFLEGTYVDNGGALVRYNTLLHATPGRSYLTWRYALQYDLWPIRTSQSLVLIATTLCSIFAIQPYRKKQAQPSSGMRI